MLRPLGQAHGEKTGFQARDPVGILKQFAEGPRQRLAGAGRLRRPRAGAAGTKAHKQPEKRKKRPQAHTRAFATRHGISSNTAHGEASAVILFIYK